MFNLISNLSPSKLFGGDSSSHFNNANEHLGQATTDASKAVKNAAYMGVNAAAFGAQVVAGFGLYKYIAGEIIGFNALAQGMSTAASYLAPEAIATAAINIGAKCTSVLASMFATNPLGTLGAVEIATLLMSPEFAINTVTYGAKTVIETAKTCVDLAYAAGEVGVGTLLLAEEGFNTAYDYAYAEPKTLGDTDVTWAA